RPADAKPFDIPAACPDCSSDVAKDHEGVYIRCTNPDCAARLKERLKYFAGRGQMDIETLGQALIEQLVDNDMVTSFADLYKLKKAELQGLERMGSKSAANVIESIEKSKTQPLWRLITALGINLIGSQSAQILADRFGSLDALIKADLQQLENIGQIGPKMAESVCQYFRDPKNITVINAMLDAGVEPAQQAVQKSDKLSGKTFVVTGTLKNFSRQQAETAIKNAGGKTSSSVSKKTDFVLAGENPGSKIQKAQQLGITIINEQQFMEML
ncbi:MAG: helix-hairpin-helix domain-containing protein, partial [Planctomycetota bacterium]